MGKLLKMRIKKLLIQILTFFSYVFLIALLVLIFVRPDLVDAGLKWLREAVLRLWFWNRVILSLSAFLESVPVLWSLLPGQTIILIIGGVLWKFNFVATLAVVVFFTLLGNLAGWRLGKTYGLDLVKKYWNKIWITQTDIIYLQKALKRYWGIVVVLGKFHGNFRSFVPFVVGMGWMDLRSFVIRNIIAALLRATVMLGIGVFVFEYWQLALKYLGWGVLGLMLLFGIFVYLRHPQAVKDYWAQKQKELKS